MISVLWRADNAGNIEVVQMLLGYAEPDHVWPCLDVRKEEIRRGFTLAL
ncbi:hypothetical protein [Aeromonas sp. Y311-2]|jgi:hypothetical protein|nr:hypothetical protein [Aeromonas sp. Y311-2]